MLLVLKVKRSLVRQVRQVLKETKARRVLPVQRARKVLPELMEPPEPPGRRALPE